MTDAERWGTAAVATVVFFAWYRTTGASETTKRIAVTAWTLFWFTVQWLFSGVSVEPIALLLGVGHGLHSVEVLLWATGRGSLTGQPPVSSWVWRAATQ